MSALGQYLPKSDVGVTSVQPPITDSYRTSRQVGSGPLSDIRDTWSCGSITSSSPRTWHALTVQNRFAPMSADVCFPNL